MTLFHWIFTILGVLVILAIIPAPFLAFLSTEYAPRRVLGPVFTMLALTMAVGLIFLGLVMPIR